MHTGLVVAALLPAVSVGATDLVSVPAVSLAEDVAGVRRASTRRGENAEGLGGEDEDAGAELHFCDVVFFKGVLDSSIRSFGEVDARKSSGTEDGLIVGERNVELDRSIELSCLVARILSQREELIAVFILSRCLRLSFGL